ncbi:MAG: glycosyltransferase family A protein, partial [Ilumatobacteraceae bacterium]
MFRFVAAALALLVLAPGAVTALHLGVMTFASLFFRAPRRGGEVPPVRFLVVIPAYNEELLLGRTLDAINADRRERDQVLVVDDRSTDRTGEIARQLGALVLTRTPDEEPGR